MHRIQNANQRRHHSSVLRRMKKPMLLVALAIGLCLMPAAISDGTGTGLVWDSGNWDQGNWQ